jgi:two-component system NtrC family sensor kinase
LDSTLNAVWNELKYKAKITKDYAQLPEVLCYPQQLNQVFVNILVKAAQAMKDMGEISIATRALDGLVEIKIADTGEDLPEDSLSKIFDPFFTTKDVGLGTGLGLNVAHSIIQKHKGSIGVESTVSKGTTYTVRIPVEGHT